MAAEATSRQARLVAHEVRNALVPVKVALNKLFETPQTADRYRPRIMAGIDRIFRFVDEMLRLDALVGATAELFDAGSAIKEALTTVSEEGGVAAEVDLPSALPPLLGSRARFVLALENVVRNAYQAVGEELRLRVSARTRENSVVLHLDDNGPGIPEELRLSVFEPGVSLRRGGTGQGLALVHEVICEEMGGEVACTESPLGGARFTLTMPLRKGGCS